MTTRSEALSFPPLRDSAQRARAFARAFLDGTGQDVVDDVVLVVSELVTNATLHAGTDFTLRLDALPDGVRVEVRDGDAAPLLAPVSVPEQGRTLLDDADDLAAVESLLEQQATTGRGLRLIATLASQWGVEHDDGGKSVWAVVTPFRSRGSSAPQVTPAAEPAAVGSDGHVVRMIAMPVRLALESDVNLDELVREFQVMGGGAVLPETAPLVDAAREILERYAQPRAAGRRSARDAAARGDRLVDVVFDVPDGAPAALRRLSDLLATVDEHCRRGHLLALAARAELQAFRGWYTEEVTRQFAGARPRPCPFPVVPPPAADGHPAQRVGLRDGDRAVLQRLAAAVTSQPEGAADLVLDVAVTALGATRASVCLLDDDLRALTIVASAGYPTDVAEHWSSFSVSADLPASEAVRTGTPVVLRTVEERNERYPAFAGTPVLSDPSLVCVPIGPQPPPAAGVLNLSFARSRDFSAHELALLTDVVAVAQSALTGRTVREVPGRGPG